MVPDTSFIFLVITFISAFLEEKKLLVLDPTVHTVSVFLLLDTSPFIGNYIHECSDSERYFSDFQCSFKLDIPVTNVTALGGNTFAGITQTSTKKGETSLKRIFLICYSGIAIFELPAQETSERLEPKYLKLLAFHF